MNPITTSRNSKDTRINIRATSEEKRLLEHAAALSHVPASQFVMQAALASAEAVVADQTRFVVNEDAWREFGAMLDRPARSIQALRGAASKPSPFRGR